MCRRTNTSRAMLRALFENKALTALFSTMIDKTSEIKNIGLLTGLASVHER